jgi:hypothetical protein
MSTVNGNGARSPFPYRLRDLPLAARLVLSVFLLAVGGGYFSALVQLHFRLGGKGNPLPTPDDIVEHFSGVPHWWSGPPPADANAAAKEPEKPVCDLERLILAPQGMPKDRTGSMAFAFFSGKSLTDEQRQERDGERKALCAWIHAPPEERKKAYEDDAFPLPDELVARQRALPGAAITKKFVSDGQVKVKDIIDARCWKCHQDEGQEGHARLVEYEDFEKYLVVPEPVKRSDGSEGAPSARQVSVEALTQTTHLHLLSFAVLFTLTGLIFSFTSYWGWVRGLLAPLALVAQVADVGCWWLARLDGVGPYFAVAIIGTGTLVGLGLWLQIVLGLFDMYGWKGKVVVALLLVGVGAGLAAAAPGLKQHLEQEKAPAPAATP